MNASRTRRAFAATVCLTASGVASESQLPDASIVVREILPIEPVGGVGVWDLDSWSITDISDDGSTVVGQTWSISDVQPDPFQGAFVWRPESETYDEFRPLANLLGNPNNPGDNIGLPYLVDDDGDRLAFLSEPVGQFPSYVSLRVRSPGLPPVLAFKWTEGEARWLVAMSSDGTSVLGTSWLDGPGGLGIARSNRWTQLGAVPLSFKRADWATAYIGFRAVSASNDLSRVLVIPLDSGDTRTEELAPGVLIDPFTLRPLRDRHPDPFLNAPSMSGDGLALVGRDLSPNKSRFVPGLWHNDNPRVRVALAPDASGGFFYDANVNGETAVGTYQHRTHPITRPMVWTKARGTRDLAAVLAKFGVAPPDNIALRSAWRVSEDGTRIAGFAAGTGPNAGAIYVYLARLPSSEVCYCNCDGSKGPNYLTAADVACFQQRLALQQFYANCDHSIDGSGQLTYDAADLQCFMDRFQVGCPE